MPPLRRHGEGKCTQSYQSGEKYPLYLLPLASARHLNLTRDGQPIYTGK
jgi:hypothetical protein